MTPRADHSAVSFNLIPGVPMAIWCIAILRKKEVIAGFAEEKPDEV